VGFLRSIMDYLTTTPEKWKNLKPFARENRNNLTLAEKVLWNFIKRNQLGVKFRRQQVIDDYIVDFVCLDLNLVIEVDGPSHLDQVEYDQNRTLILNSIGFEVVRFTNEEIIGNPNLVEMRLKEIINNLKPHP
jgi:very-short-patch-repair endonuclease